jgi:hypothetical protein
VPKRYETHKNYDLFKIGQKVRILNFDIDVTEPGFKAMKDAQGKETFVRQRFNHCITLDIDNGHWGWSYDWIQPVLNCLPDRLFEI